MSEVSIKWLELKRFVAIDKANHSIVLSGTEKDGKIGIKPVDLLSMSLGSCMALSIIYYFQKNNQQLDNFEVNVKQKCR
jgi:putative redox protein